MVGSDASGQHSGALDAEGIGLGGGDRPGLDLGEYIQHLCLDGFPTCGLVAILLRVDDTSRSERRRYSQVLEAVRTNDVLTVGETAEFLDAGGIVSFTMLQEVLQFDVNLDGANKVRLKISAQMLALARRVVHNADGAKI